MIRAGDAHSVPQTVVAVDGMGEAAAQAGQAMLIAAVVQLCVRQIIHVDAAAIIPHGLAGLDGRLLLRLQQSHHA